MGVGVGVGRAAVLGPHAISNKKARQADNRPRLFRFFIRPASLLSDFGDLDLDFKI
jgi:hypothetical protein